MPASLGGLAVVVVDGKKIKRVAKRLLPTRHQPGKLYGGKLLVAYLPAEGVAVALAADADGEANDIRSVPYLLPTVRGVVTGTRLWVADRQFCDLIQPRRFADGGDHFVVRYGNNTGFHPDHARAAVEGTDVDGRAVRQEWGWLGAEKQGERRLYVRRVTLARPGDEDVGVVTDLLDEQRYPAADLLAIWLTRWQIEIVFQQITEVFHLQRLIGCRPLATVFQASLCLVLFNVLQLVRGHITAGRPEPTLEAVSGEQGVRRPDEGVDRVTRGADGRGGGRRGVGAGRRRAAAGTPAGLAGRAVVAEVGEGAEPDEATREAPGAEVMWSRFRPPTAPGSASRKLQARPAVMRCAQKWTVRTHEGPYSPDAKDNRATNRCLKSASIDRSTLQYRCYTVTHGFRAQTLSKQAYRAVNPSP